MTQDRERGVEGSSQDRKQLSTADLAGRDERTGTAETTPGSHDAGQGTADVSGTRNEETAEPLFPSDETEELRQRWQAIQAGFVDEPRKAVESADTLVASTMKRLAEIFAKERDGLESQWDRGDDVSTEDLRVALRRYRSFFDRLLSM